MVLILQNVPSALRGELARWLIEPHPGVFVGHVSARVRDWLWQHCLTRSPGGSIIQIWATNTEQHFDIRSWGDAEREMVSYEGVWLVRRRPGASGGSAVRVVEGDAGS